MELLRSVHSKHPVLEQSIAILKPKRSINNRMRDKSNQHSHPSNKPNEAKTMNGDALPTYSYINPPNGGPTEKKTSFFFHVKLFLQTLNSLKTPNASPPKAVPMAFPRSSSSGYRSANMPRPENKTIFSMSFVRLV